MKYILDSQKNSIATLTIIIFILLLVCVYENMTVVAHHIAATC